MSTTYVHFSDLQKERARCTDLVSFLNSNGETLKRSGSEYEWQSPTGKVTIRGNLWYHQYDQEGGDAISFVQKFTGKSYPEAVISLLGEDTLPVQRQSRNDKESSHFVLPERNENMRRVFAYLLNRRCIDRNVIYAFAHKDMIFESLPYHNVVFVGFNSDGKPCHANKRGTGSESSFKGNEPGSLPEYSFHWNGSDNELYGSSAQSNRRLCLSGGPGEQGWRVLACRSINCSRFKTVQVNCQTGSTRSAQRRIA